MTRLLLAILLLAGVVGTTPSSPAQNDSLSEATLERVRRAAVEVHLDGQLRGGGAFVRSDSGRLFVLTAAHLFRSPRDTCRVVTEDGESHFASLSAYDLGHDLALLEVDPDNSRYGALEIAASAPRETQPIFNFGPALRRRTLVLTGHVADSRTCYTDFSSSHGSIAHFFAAGINPVLTSGGVWVNRGGKIVGVQHGRLIGDRGAPSSGLSMVSLPAAIKRLLEEREIARTPALGGYVWELWTADRSLLDELPKGLEGVFVKPVFEGRPLARAGLAPHDVIVACDGQPIRRRHELLEIIRSRPVGSTFLLEVVRPGDPEHRAAELTTDSLEEHWR